MPRPLPQLELQFALRRRGPSQFGARRRIRQRGYYYYYYYYYHYYYYYTGQPRDNQRTTNGQPGNFLKDRPPGRTWAIS